MNTSLRRKPASSSGFSLIELLAVVVIMSVMLALTAPAFSSFKNTMGRKGAMNQLLNTFEQARVAALTQGAKVYVGFADANSSFPDAYKYKSYIIFRDRLDTDPGTTKYVPLSKWTLLPTGISLQSDTKGSTGTTLIHSSNRLATPITDGSLPELIKGTPITNLPVLTFNTSGYIETDSKKLRLLIYEGFYAPVLDRDQFTSPERPFYDMIGFRKYSGRAEVFMASKVN